MAIRRTREQKQRIEARRQEGLTLSWRPTEKPAAMPKKGKVAGVPSAPLASPRQDISYLRRDLSRTAVAVGLSAGMLFLSWWLG